MDPLHIKTQTDGWRRWGLSPRFCCACGLLLKWVNPIIVAREPDRDICTCLDPVDLNKALKRKHYPLETVEKVAASMSEPKFFSNLDAMSGCYQIKLAKKVVGLVRSCPSVWYLPQEFFKGLSLRCVTTSRNDKSLLIS